MRFHGFCLALTGRSLEAELESYDQLTERETVGGESIATREESFQGRTVPAYCAIRLDRSSVTTGAGEG
jgi:hypothetical protein